MFQALLGLDLDGTWRRGDHRPAVTVTVPFEYQGDDKVGVHPDPPVTLLPWGVRLWVVGGQDDSRRACQIPATCRCPRRKKEMSEWLWQPPHRDTRRF